jgi:hypothetical protein
MTQFNIALHLAARPCSDGGGEKPLFAAARFSTSVPHLLGQLAPLNGRVSKPKRVSPKNSDPFPASLDPGLQSFSFGLYFKNFNRKINFLAPIPGSVLSRFKC